MKIAYGGIPGSVSYNAAQDYFGAKHTYIGYKTYHEILKSVSSGKSDAGLIPVENSLSGTIYEHYDLLNEHSVKVTGELYHKIEHDLLGLKTDKNGEARLKELKKVYSRPDALEQSERFLSQHKWLQPEATTDTAEAAQLIKKHQDISLAAIANKSSAKIYDLTIVVNNIEDNPHNITRFLAVSQKTLPRIDGNKASLIFIVSDEPGSLYGALAVFESYELNLTKIESRPVYGKPHPFVFYVDFEYGEEHKLRMDEIVAVFQENTSYLKILGYYQSVKRPV